MIGRPVAPEPESPGRSRPDEIYYTVSPVPCEWEGMAPALSQELKMVFHDSVVGRIGKVINLTSWNGVQLIIQLNVLCLLLAQCPCVCYGTIKKR